MIMIRVILKIMFNNINKITLKGYSTFSRNNMQIPTCITKFNCCHEKLSSTTHSRYLFTSLAKQLTHIRYFSWILFAQLCCLFSTTLFVSVIEAAEWTTEPSVSFGVGYDDNVALTTEPHKSVSSISLSPRVKFGRATETSAVNIGLLLSATDYSDSAVEDESEQILSLRSFSRATERTRLEVDGEIRRENLFETILIDPGTGDLRDTDIGLIDTKIKRTWKTIKPSWKHSLTERSSLRLGYRVTDVSFSDTSSPDVVDYDENLLSASYSYRVTTTSDLSFGVTSSRYRPSDNGDKSETIQLTVGTSRAFLETTRGYFSVGTSKTTEATPTGEVETSGSVFEAGIVQTSELSTLEGVISRDVHPSGAGKLVKSNQVRIYYDRPVTKKLNFRAQVNLFRDKVIDGSDLGIDRRYYEVQPELHWRWLPQWYFRTSYRYRKQKFDAEPDTAKSNALFLGAGYIWPKISASR
jgi:hypothetical protein